VQFALSGHGDGSVAIRRSQGYEAAYSSGYVLMPLDAVAGKTRVMEDELIAASGNDVTPAFSLYLRPLLGADMPQAARLQAPALPKLLTP
jgi:6-phosphofructokinase 1